MKQGSRLHGGGDLSGPPNCQKTECTPQESTKFRVQGELIEPGQENTRREHWCASGSPGRRCCSKPGSCQTNGSAPGRRPTLRHPGRPSLQDAAHQSARRPTCNHPRPAAPAHCARALPAAFPARALLPHPREEASFPGGAGGRRRLPPYSHAPAGVTAASTQRWL